MTRKQTTAFKTYSDQLKSRYREGDATEHTYRPALQAFIESFGESLRATNEPGKKSRGKNTKNKPDFIVKKGSAPIGFIETKDIGVDLTDTEDTDQIERYCAAYPNLIVTDYLEFRRYVKGELRSEVKIGRSTKNEITLTDHHGEELVKFFEDFLLEETFSISSAAELAERLAAVTRQIRKLVRKELEVEEESARLHKLMIAFKKVLLADLNEDKFADMFAQTLAYGFFAAKVHFDGKGEFSRRTASTILPRTNPFLRKLFREFADENLPESLIGAVDEIVELLKKTDLQKILNEFGAQGKNDAVIHFYESFLGAFDPKLKKEMGVFYTPDPVVDYIARSLDEILIEKFDRKKGLADDKALLLDPALGTGSFLHKIIDVVHSKVPKGTWDSYVSENLLNRIFGFEILMAPYAVAHLNLGIKLQKTGYKFEKDQRLGVFLTNTLEETAKRSEVLFADWISEEAQAAASIKRDSPIMVVTGNPPYSGISANKNPWIEGLLKGFDKLNNKKVSSYFEVEGKPLNEKKQWLNDDYVKFIRFAQWRIEQTGFGVLAFITNHGFLDNPTFRGMRYSLMSEFDEIFVLDLHGNKKKKEVCPDGTVDHNVFDIQQGVSINFMIRHKTNSNAGKKLASVHRAELWGTRDKKFDWLKENTFKSTKFKRTTPASPFFTFIHQDNELSEEYYTGLKVTDIFPIHNSGMVTACDSLSIQFSKEQMWSTVKEFSRLSPDEAKQKWDLGGNRDWTVEWAQQDVLNNKLSQEKVRPITYRPYDNRWTYYTGNMKGFVCNPRDSVMKHMTNGKNLALISARSNKSNSMDHFFVTTNMMETKAGESTTQSAIFPLFRFDESLKGKVSKSINLAEPVQQYIKEMLGSCDEEKAEVFFDYMYSIFHSPSYRKKYHSDLKQDFPRVQLTDDKALFKKLAKMGAELRALHLLDDGRLSGGKVDFPVKGTNKVEVVKFDKKNEFLWINKTQYFSNIPENVFEHTVGGYQVIDKWLKYRKGMKLEYSSISHIEQVAESIVRTIDMTQKIDGVIESAGGWPLATVKMSKKAA